MPWPTPAASTGTSSSRRGARRLQRQLSEVAPAVEDQRRRARAALATFDLADEDDVVALGIAAAVEALEYRCRALEHRCAAGRPVVAGDAGEAVGLAAREAQRQLLLLGREDVDRVVRAFGEHLQRGGGAGQAPRHQRRVERD